MKKLYIAISGIKKLFIKVTPLKLYTGIQDEDKFDGFDYTLDFSMN